MFIKLFSTSILVFIFCISETASAQNWQFGIKAGLSLPNLTSSGSSEVSKGYKTISGPDLASVVDYKFSKQFSIESGVELSTQGGQKSGLQTIPANPDLAPYFPPGTEYLYANFTSTVRLQYLMLPVLLKYTLDLGNTGKWKLYADAGIFGALLTKAEASASGSSKVYFDKEETDQVGTVTVQFDSTGNIKNQLHKGNFGITGNLGLLYQVNSTAYFIEGGGSYGFIGLQKDTRNGVNHTGALIFRIGFLMGLSNNHEGN